VVVFDNFRLHQVDNHLGDVGAMVADTLQLLGCGAVMETGFGIFGVFFYVPDNGFLGVYFAIVYDIVVFANAARPTGISFDEGTYRVVHHLLNFVGQFLYPENVPGMFQFREKYGVVADIH
jgi:hypothetical protein